MATHELNLKLSTVQVFILALGLGIAVGIPTGIAAYQYGWSKGALGNHSSAQVGFFTFDDEAVCVNGVVYAPDRTDPYPAWHGVYRPLTQGRPALTDEDGHPVMQRSIPVRCKIGNGDDYNGSERSAEVVPSQQ